MSFASLEIADYGSKPIPLFEFHRDATVYRYTGTDRDLAVDGDVYTAAPIACGAMRYTDDAQSDELTITGPASLQVFEDFASVTPSDRVRAFVRRYHIGHAPATRWAGFVDRVVRNGRRADIICDSLQAGLRQNGARLIWQRGCPHALYGRDCKVDKGAHAFSAVVDSKNGAELTAGGLVAAGTGRLKGGYIEWATTNGFRAWRAINDHGDEWIQLLGGTDGIDVGMTIMAYRSCTHTPEACETFGNGPNYGGIRHLPGKSPFDGNPVF